MIAGLRIRLAHWILGRHHTVVNFQQHSADAIAKHKERKANNEQPTHTGQPGY